MIAFNGAQSILIMLFNCAGALYFTTRPTGRRALLIVKRIAVWRDNRRISSEYGPLNSIVLKL